MSDGQRLAFDHIVLLVPYSYLHHPPNWINDNFTLSPGGVHGDGKTENRLVLFRDGTYLELIAFVNDDPEHRRGHWWDKPFGVVDFALTSTTDSVDYAAINARLQSSGTGVSYGQPKEGGRSTGGKQLKWKVGIPQGVERGNVPFFCEDVTPREWRVAITDKNTSHPSSVVGLAGMVLECSSKGVGRLSKATSAILAVEQNASHRYEIGTPYTMQGLAANKPSVRFKESTEHTGTNPALTLVLQTAKGESRGDIREPIEDGLVAISFE